MNTELKAFGDIYENVDLKKYNTYGIGGQAQYLIKPFTVDDLVNLIKFLKTQEVPYFILGRGSNVILPDEDFKGVIIVLDSLKNMVFHDDMVEVEAGCPNALLVNKCLAQSYTNLAFLHGIPGLIGASIRGNAGCYNQEIMEYVIDITILDETGQIKTIKKENLKYSYRYTSLKENHDILIKATLKLIKGDAEAAQLEINENLAKRRASQPLEYRSAGSVFKNPTGLVAGKLIEECGLKGYTIGGAKVSEKHANFIINYQDATSTDIINLINVIKNKVKEEKGIDLELEQEIIKW